MDTNTTKRKTAGGRMRPECVNWDPEVRIKKNGASELLSQDLVRERKNEWSLVA